MRERVDAGRAADVLGIPRRTVLDLAAKGTIPAAKVGRRWTFSEVQLRDWLKKQEERCRDPGSGGKPRNSATGGAMPSGRASRSMGRNSEDRYEQAMRKLLSGACGSGGTGN